METRIVKMGVCRAGGTAGKGSKRHNLCFPNAWAKAMGITTDSRDIEMVFDGEQVIIRKAEGVVNNEV